LHAKRNAAGVQRWQWNRSDRTSRTPSLIFHETDETCDLELETHPGRGGRFFAGPTQPRQDADGTILPQRHDRREAPAGFHGLGRGGVEEAPTGYTRGQMAFPNNGRLTTRSMKIT
jgi:hypothetical protein